MNSPHHPAAPLRIAFIGVGSRGLATLERYMMLDGVEVAALCDLDTTALERGSEIVGRRFGRKPPCFSDWRDDALLTTAPDAALISTDWATHATIACACMERGLDVAVEVPAALSVAECRQLTATADATGRRCLMLENCCYDPFALRTLEMARRGIFGEIIHCEAAYIHDLRKLYASNPWYGHQSSLIAGNPYPTHGIGPVCQLLDAVEGGDDRLVSLVSMSTSAGGPDVPPVNTTIISTLRGRTVTLHYDVMTPRPYSRIQSVSGSKAYITKYPVAEFMADGMEGPICGKDLEDMMERFRHPFEEMYGPDGTRLGVSNMMNYIMDRRIVDILRLGLRPDITVRDAALWSSLAELTSESASQGGLPVVIPEF